MSSSDDVMEQSSFSDSLSADVAVPCPDAVPPDFSPGLRGSSSDNVQEAAPINYGALMEPTCSTAVTYGAIQYAYDFFNQTLFASRLPGALITLRAERRSIAYFSRHRFANRQGTMVDEIAMNSSYFGLWPIECTLSALVHEMCHQALHYTEGVKPQSLRSTYHSKQWADLMIGVGLFPSSTGRPGGKMVGESIGHYIIEGGNFFEACRALVSRQFRMEWYDRYPSLDAINSQAIATVSINPADPGSPHDQDDLAASYPLGIPGETKVVLRKIAESIESGRARADDARRGNHAAESGTTLDTPPLPVVTSYAIDALRKSLGPQGASSKKNGRSKETSSADRADSSSSTASPSGGKPVSPVATTLLIPDHDVGGLIETKPASKPNRSKTSYACPLCESMVWGKPNLKLRCGCSDQLPEFVSVQPTEVSSASSIH